MLLRKQKNKSRIFIIKTNNYKRDDKYLILKKILKKFYNLEIDIEEIQKNIYGKPRLNHIKFNLSDTLGYISIIIGNDEVGIDIERIRKVDSIMIEKILDSTEQISKNNNYLLKHWVGKEAYVKYIGIGIIEDFNKLNLKQLQKHNNHLMKVTNRYIVFAYAKEKISKKIIYLDENDIC